MALDRFSNIKEIQETNGKVRGIVWKESDYDILQLDLKNVAPEERPIVELQLYTIGVSNTYIAGGIIDDYEFKGDKLYINYGQACQSLGIERGQFEVVVNIYKNLLGSADNRDLYIKEISDDRRELWIKAKPNTNPDVDTYLNSFGSGVYAETTYEEDSEGNRLLDDDGNPVIASITERPLSDDIYLNFGENRLYKILNQKDWNDENDFVVRLYGELPETFEEKSDLWVVEQLADSYIDNINLQGPGATELESKKLLGPNFNIDIYGATITETDFQSWNQLLDANTSTSQQIVDRLFSGSLDSTINIDYSGFQNFIHFSSAQERLSNFKYKLGLIEYYDDQIRTLNAATGDDAGALQGNLATNQSRKDSVISSFDGFERWLYYEPTSSLFTHHDSVYSNNNNSTGVYRADGGYIGAKPYRLQSWPKFLEDGVYKLHPSTSSIGETWFTGYSATASLYDSENVKSLSRTIPEHIRLDSNNDQYELFVNMIGHHFDILYSHIENLTEVYKPEEHPKLGQSKDTLYEVAQSLGWTLQNGNQAEALWKYKLGVDSGSGAYAQTGSLFSKSNEAITTEVWRRIVNNLPYLLKTKGTTRSIKALMNTYGIPQTLLSIREYGGPKVGEDTPTLIEDRFTYALNIPSGSQVRYVRDKIKFADLEGRGIDVQNNPTISAPGGISNVRLNHRPPDTIEFRFKPDIKNSMIMLSHKPSANANTHWNFGIQYTGSYSGSDQYGRLFFQVRDLNSNTSDSSQEAGSKYDEYVGNSIVSYSEYVPLYDGDFWNVRLFTAFPYVTSSLISGDNFVPDIFFETQKASDYIDDKIVHRTSGSINFGSGSSAANGGTLVNNWGESSTAKILVLGGDTGSGHINTKIGDQFDGQIQEYREWMEVLDQEAFNLHTTNPSSYVSSISPTSSFDTLIRHYPFGTDLNAVDHSTGAGLFVTSSHPDQTLQDFSTPLDDGANQYASMSMFPTPTNTQRGNYERVEETYYIQGVSLGANVPRSQKIRFDNNELVRKLTPTNTAEKSRFDRAPIDTNKLGLFYSTADHINKDIFNQIGDVELDDFVGDPDHEFTFNYPDLIHFSKEYWKKYTDKNDLNAFIKIFSQFDFSLFNQIKQLLPERVDEAMGVLVEPHALERVKVKLADKPIKEELHYDGNIPEPVKNVEGSTTPLSASIPSAPTLVPEQIYHVGSSGYSDSGNYIARLSGSNSGIPGGDPYDSMSYLKSIFPIDERPAITGSILNVYAVAFNEPSFTRDADFRWDIAKGDNIRSRDNSSMEHSAGTVGGLPFASDKVRVQFDTYIQTDSIEDIRINITHLDNASGGQANLHARLISTKDNDAGNLILRSSPYLEYHLTETIKTNITFSGTSRRDDTILFKDVYIPSRTNVTLEIFYTSQLDNGAGGSAIRPHIDRIESTRTISQTNHSSQDIVILTPRPSTIYKLDVLHYSGSATLSKRNRNHAAAISESLGGGIPSKFNYSRSLAETGYLDDFFEMDERKKFLGSRLTGPGINIASDVAAINGKPVIEIFETNPNTLVYTNEPNVSNPGNLTVR